MAFKIPNFYQKTSPLRQEMTHSGNPIPEGTVFYGEGEGSIPMPLTGAEKVLADTEELLKFDPATQFNQNRINDYNDPNDPFNNGKNFNINNINKTLKNINRGGAMPEGNQNEHVEGIVNPEVDKEQLDTFRDTMELNVPKDPQNINWSEAPSLGTPERTQWYIDNNLKLDHTTPQLEVAETEPIEEVMSSEPIVRNNRRTRRRDRIIARNEKAELRNKKAKLRNKGIKGDVKFGDTTLIDGKYVDQDFQDPNIS